LANQPVIPVGALEKGSKITQEAPVFLSTEFPLFQSPPNRNWVKTGFPVQGPKRFGDKRVSQGIKNPGTSENQIARRMERLNTGLNNLAWGLEQFRNNLIIPAITEESALT